MENERKIQFSDRELEVLACLIIGEKSYKSTGKLLNISPKTVETHLRRTLIRCNCDAKSEMIKYLNLHDLEKRYNFIVGNVTSINIKQQTSSNDLWKKLAAVGVSLIVLTGVYQVMHKEKVFGSNIKLLNNSALIIRKELTKKIENIFDQQKNIRFVVISGVGGSGKSTLARCFMKEHSSNMKWEINSETEQELEYSFFKLAKNFVKVRGLNKNLKKIEEISNVKHRREALISFVAENLKEINNWILLFDNVKDIRTIQEYLPSNNEVWGNGFVVITTRNAKLSDRAPFFQKSHIKISELTPNEQLDLFILIRGLDRSIEDQKENLKTLLQNIPLLPLDTAIAAYYVKNTCVVLNDYIRYLQEFSYDFQKVQAQIAINHIDYDKTRFSIIASDFNEIICSNSEFKELLLFVCLMNPQYISIKHLKQLKNSITVDNFIYELQKYSLIYANDANNGLGFR